MIDDDDDTAEAIEAAYWAAMDEAVAQREAERLMTLDDPEPMDDEYPW